MKKKSLFRHYDEFGKLESGRKKKRPLTAKQQELENAKAQLRKLQKEVNPRIRQLQKLRTNRVALSKALLDIEESGGKIRLSGMNTVSKVYQEIMRAQNFLNDETSSVEGAKKFNRILHGQDMSVGEWKNDAWSIVHRLEQIDPTIKSDKGYGYELVEEIEQYLEAFNFTDNAYDKDTLADYFETKLKEIKQRVDERNSSFEEYVSDPFNMV